MSSTNVEVDENEFPEASLRNIIDSNLKWVFVGGKGGVGKTTTSCCLSIQLAEKKMAEGKKVLIISTDPAHNLSDAFNQKFTKEPSLVNGFENLFCMEIEASFDMEEANQLANPNGDGSGTGNAPGSEEMNGFQGLIQDISTSIPGIDEIISFAELMKQVENMDYDTVVFDTAPTGHTLRLLSFPTTLESAFSKIMAFKSRLSGMMGQFNSMIGQQAGSEDALLDKLEQTREVIEKVNQQFRDPEATTFVCVCIPEFLSLYETERLVQELAKYGIDSKNIVVNQVLFPEKDADDMSAWYENSKSSLPDEAQDIIAKSIARKRMQDKYINNIFELYELFHVVLMPLLDHEVRGIPALKEFSGKLISPPDEGH